MSMYLARCLGKPLIQTETNPESLRSVDGKKYVFPGSWRSVAMGEEKGSFGKDGDCKPGRTAAGTWRRGGLNATF